MAWLAEHYKDLILAVLAIDAALIPLLPNVPLLVKIKELLSGLVK
jgi:hypothetical protein